MTSIWNKKFKIFCTFFRSELPLSWAFPFSRWCGLGWIGPQRMHLAEVRSLHSSLAHFSCPWAWVSSQVTRRGGTCRSHSLTDLAAAVSLLITLGRVMCISEGCQVRGPSFVDLQELGMDRFQFLSLHLGRLYLTTMVSKVSPSELENSMRQL